MASSSSSGGTTEATTPDSDVPAVLESTQLGVKLVATVENPEPEPGLASS